MYKPKKGSQCYQVTGIKKATGISDSKTEELALKQAIKRAET